MYSPMVFINEDLRRQIYILQRAMCIPFSHDINWPDDQGNNVHAQWNTAWDACNVIVPWCSLMRTCEARCTFLSMRCVNCIQSLWDQVSRVVYFPRLSPQWTWARILLVPEPICGLSAFLLLCFSPSGYLSGVLLPQVNFTVLLSRVSSGLGTTVRYAHSSIIWLIKLPGRHTKIIHSTGDQW